MIAITRKQDHHPLFRQLGMGMVAVALALGVNARADDRAVKSRVPPLYPEIAKRMHISGVVKIEATVDAEGKVTAAKTVDGNRTLGQAAEEAVSKWRFAAGDGTSTVTVSVNFSLGQ